MTIVIDTREPHPHPWEAYWPKDTVKEYACIDTGDMCVKGFDDYAVVERKTASDFLGCVGGNRDRFERELQRAQFIGHFCIIVEASLPQIMSMQTQIYSNAIIGTVNAWTRRGAPVLFAGNVEYAARMALRWLQQPFAECEKVTNKVKRLDKTSSDKLSGEEEI